MTVLRPVGRINFFAYVLLVSVEIQRHIRFSILNRCIEKKNGNTARGL